MLVETLERVLRTIKQGWCQRAWARDCVGETVKVNSIDACKWCLDGAILLETARDSNVSRKVSLFVQETLESLGHTEGYVTYNDEIGRTQQDIVNLLERAIDRAKNIPSNPANAS